ncbi:rolling circle replication-associated protein [Clostridium botulinum]|uniref:rolling circle replication-associated protein n=1 Tax=Clostridium botulinum TaxID=1491 RepID=UPI000AADF8C8|nr:hypothetical protein [Clostridium botulinum]
MKSFIREKKIHCGKTGYKEIDIIPRTEIQEKNGRSKRRKRIRETEPKQKNLNDKNSKRYLVQVGNGNFTEDDLHISATYNPKFLPSSVEEAEKEVTNFLSRIKYNMKKKGTSELKYILVTEYNFDKGDSNKVTRIHHHIIINGGLDRDTIEELWSRPKRKGEKKRERLGWINADRLQFNENGIEGLCKYITKNSKGKKRWSSSRNLIRPYNTKNDNKYSKRKIAKLAKDPNILETVQKLYPELDIVKINTVYYEDTGWHIYIKGWEIQKRRN